MFFVFQGHRNYLIMLLAYALTITGAVLAGFSKTWFFRIFKVGYTNGD